jgi:hypothetical protein
VDERCVCFYSLVAGARPQQPRFSTIIVSLTLWDDVQDATWAHEMDGNFWCSGTSTYQRSCKINFFTITHS